MHPSAFLGLTYPYDEWLCLNNMKTPLTLGINPLFVFIKHCLLPRHNLCHRVYHSTLDCLVYNGCDLHKLYTSIENPHQYSLLDWESWTFLLQLRRRLIHLERASRFGTVAAVVSCWAIVKNIDLKSPTLIWLICQRRWRLMTATVVRSDVLLIHFPTSGRLDGWEVVTSHWALLSKGDVCR